MTREKKNQNKLLLVEMALSNGLYCVIEFKYEVNIDVVEEANELVNFVVIVVNFVVIELEGVIICVVGLVVVPRMVVVVGLAVVGEFVVVRGLVVVVVGFDVVVRE